jgi:hypothetical protein
LRQGQQAVDHLAVCFSKLGLQLTAKVAKSWSRLERERLILVEKFFLPLVSLTQQQVVGYLYQLDQVFSSQVAQLLYPQTTLGQLGQVDSYCLKVG